MAENRMLLFFFWQKLYLIRMVVNISHLPKLYDESSVLKDFQLFGTRQNLIFWRKKNKKRSIKILKNHKNADKYNFFFTAWTFSLHLLYQNTVQKVLLILNQLFLINFS